MTFLFNLLQIQKVFHKFWVFWKLGKQNVLCTLNFTQYFIVFLWSSRKLLLILIISMLNDFIHHDIFKISFIRLIADL